MAIWEIYGLIPHFKTLNKVWNQTYIVNIPVYTIKEQTKLHRYFPGVHSTCRSLTNEEIKPLIPAREPLYSSKVFKLPYCKTLVPPWQKLLLIKFMLMQLLFFKNTFQLHVGLYHPIISFFFLIVEHRHTPSVELLTSLREAKTSTTAPSNKKLSSHIYLVIG